jgi:hypothetical protein
MNGNDEKYPFPGPDPAGKPTAEDGGVIEEYEGGCQLVRECRDGKPDLYHFDNPLNRMKTFENPDKARLYADVHTAVGGFREEKSGERGVPPAVAASREDAMMAYLAAQPSMSTEWVARFYEIDEGEVREYIRLLRQRAREQRD